MPINYRAGNYHELNLHGAILAMLLDEVNASLNKPTSKKINDYLFNSDFTFIEVIHYYELEELKCYDVVIDFDDYV